MATTRKKAAVKLSPEIEALNNIGQYLRINNNNEIQRHLDIRKTNYQHGFLIWIMSILTVCGLIVGAFYIHDTAYVNGKSDQWKEDWRNFQESEQNRKDSAEQNYKYRVQPSEGFDLKSFYDSMYILTDTGWRKVESYRSPQTDTGSVYVPSDYIQLSTAH